MLQRKPRASILKTGGPSLSQMAFQLRKIRFDYHISLLSEIFNCIFKNFFCHYMVKRFENL